MIRQLYCLSFFLLLAAISLTIVSCRRLTSPNLISSDCKKLNSQGVDSLMAYKVHLKKTKTTLESSLDLFNKAIACDSNFNVARSNKIAVLNEMGRTDEAILSIDDFIVRTKDSTMLLMKGGIYEMQKKSELSMISYKIAYSYFKKKLDENPKNSSAIYFKILAQSKIFGRASVQSEIDYYLKKYPDDQNLKAVLTDTITLGQASK